MNQGNSSLPKSERLRRTHEFSEVFKSGKVFRKDGLALYVKQSLPTSKSRVGIVISKKAAKLAVRRNRIKRASREFFRTQKTHFKDGFDLVIRVIDSSKVSENKELRNILAELFERANVNK